MRSTYYAGYRKTKKGRVVYARKKHFFKWQEVSRIITNMQDDTKITDINQNKLERYFGRMRAATYLHIYAMFRQYPDVMRKILLEMVLPQNNGQTDNFAETWKKITLDICQKGLDVITGFIPDEKIGDNVSTIIMAIANGYYDWLFGLIKEV